MQSALLSPIRFSGRLRAMVCFLSRSPARFTEGDVLTAKRIARYIALAMSHDHLAAEAKRATELRERTANLELLDQLLLSLTDTGELGDLFDRLSALARQVLPYDALVLHVVVPDRGRLQQYLTSGSDISHRSDLVDMPAGFVRDPDWESDLMDDVTTRPEPVELSGAETGFRAILRVPVRL